MREILDIDVLADEVLRQRMVVLSLGMLAAGLAVSALVLVGEKGVGLGLSWFTALIAGSLAALPVHELVHAAAFKLLVPGVRVGFGFKDAFLYTTVNGAVVPRSAELAALLAPAVVVTAALVAAAVTRSCPALAVLLAATHLSGCVGDLLMAHVILREPACTHVRDTEFGITLLKED